MGKMLKLKTLCYNIWNIGFKLIILKEISRNIYLEGKGNYHF